MITITEKSKIMIWGPSSYVRTGGAEMLNMLAAYLKSLGVNARMFNWCMPGEYEQGEYYKLLYDINCGTWKEVVDTPDTVVVLPDTMIEYFEDETNLHSVNVIEFSKRFQHAQVLVWWMSSGFDFSGYINRRIVMDTLKSYKHILHAYEPTIMRNDLEYYGINEVVPLQHGTNPLYYNYPVKYQKTNTVFYNGYKGLNRMYIENEIIPKVHAKRPDIMFETVNGDNGIGSYKSKSDMCDIYDKTKVYIDFCGFAGRELMPREACIRDCILILGNEGTAALGEDYPIQKEYKVDKNDSDAICDLIIDCIDNYDKRISDFIFFKNKCMYEPHKWKWEIYNIFGPAIKKPFDEQ